MPGKKFGKVLIVLLIIIVIGVFVIDLLSQQFHLPRLFSNLMMVSFVIAVILVALFVGRSMTSGSGSEEADEDIAIPSDRDKMKARQYAWLNPYGVDLRAGYPLTRPLTIIGRESNADILINDLSVSRKHAQILYTGGGFILKDLDSNNGTFINNQRIEETYLADGDMVTIGEIKFVFSCGSIKAIPDHISDVDMSFDIDLDLGDLGTQVGTGSHLMGTGTRTGTGTRSGTRFKDLAGETFAPEHKKKFGDDEGNDPNKTNTNKK